VRGHFAAVVHDSVALQQLVHRVFVQDATIDYAEGRAGDDSQRGVVQGELCKGLETAPREKEERGMTTTIPLINGELVGYNQVSLPTG